MKRSKAHRIDNLTLSYIAESLGNTINCGIPIDEAFEMIKLNLKNKYHKEAITLVRDKVREGYSISKAMGGLNIFPVIFKEMILIGENTGKLQETLDSLGNFYKNLHTIKKKIVNALIYPMILISLIILISVIMFIYLLPQFIDMYSSLEIVPKGICKMIFDLRKSFDKMPVVSCINVVCYGVLIPYILCFKIFNTRIMKIIGKFKFFNQFIEFYIIQVFYLIFQSGVNVQNALYQFGNEVNIPVVKEKVLYIYENLIQGKALSLVLDEMSCISLYTISFVKVGEETGTLSERLKSLAEEKEKQITYKTDSITTIIEPTIILILSTVIISMFIIFLLPIYDGVKL
ncbi:type II secretion system F family protein [Clostridium sp. 'White wine YQ']|uniref:type II secretion system F family protein n=1 Tax=Clostridium sp. 'White wine YQ' TaxID=3027474 RepID=UPI0023670FE7|nr:type II secretion system F family protein [Clostridium sp. 'White wine YQ']MDD7793956.1 type II secretion system F family protein [Clostridium sp. 'White wine YQ']